MPGETRIIGLGNPDRGDDAVGRLVARSLAQDPPAGASVRECDGDAAELLAVLQGATRVVLVDAADFGAEPGRVRRLDAAAGALPLWAAWSTHGPGLAAAVELARALGQLPEQCVILAVQAGDLTPGRGLSPAVAAALPGLAARVRAELAAP